MCLSGAYRIPNLGYQYVEILHNISIHISSVTPHFGTVGRRTLQPYPCHILLVDITTMRNHVILLCFKNTTCHFTRPYVLRIVDSAFDF